MSDSPNRIFHYAILASLALHALLFVAFPELVIETARRAASIPPQIIARLMEPEPAPAPPAPPAPAEEVQPPARKKEVKQEVKRPRPVEAVPAPIVTEPVIEPAPPPVAAIEPQPASPPVTAAQPAASAPATAPAPAPESLSRDQYRVQLIDEARRHKRYPPLARENNWQGDVLVGVVVGANGRAAVTLKGSSGHEVLDRQALEMFRQAARAVPVPPSLRGKEFALDVRAVYGLED